MSNQDAESRDNSPDPASEKRASKKRKVLSCYACRDRKMKCDRVYPICGRCQKTGRADQCSYDPRLLEDLHMNGNSHGDHASHFVLPESGLNGAHLPSTASSEALTWKLRVQERRLEMMEKKFARWDKTTSDPWDAPSYLEDVKPDATKIFEQTMFRGKGFKIQFYGTTSPYSLIAKFGELQAFIREAIANEFSMGRIRNDFKVFRQRRKALAQERKGQGRDDDVIALVPEKGVVEAHVALYFRHIECSYRILHEPTFWKDFQAFWNCPEDEKPSAGFAAILVLMIATTKCLHTDPINEFVGDSSAERESALEMTDAMDTWIARQSRKKLTLHVFQIHCLSLLAKRLNCLQLKQDWTTAGDVVRLAMASGLHRDPALLSWGRITEYEQEMRRRLWVTMMELELQSSIDRGLPSSLCGLHFDVRPPANVPDDAFTPESQMAPAGRPMEHFTTSSYLIVTLKSLPLRIHLMQLLNNPTTELNYSDVLHYDAQLTALLSSLPTWEDSRSAIPSALLDLQLRQFLLVLHQPYAKLAAKNSQFQYSFTTCISAANAMLSVHDALINKGIFLLSHLRNDVMRAGITLAQVVYHNCHFPPQIEPSATAPTPASSTVAPSDAPLLNNPMKNPSPRGPEFRIPQLPINNFMAVTLCTSAIDLIERSRTIFEHKCLRLGTGFMEYFLLSASINIMPTSTASAPPTSISAITTTDDLRARCYKAVTGITSLCCRVLALQKDPGTAFASSLRNTISTANAPGQDARTQMANLVVPVGASHSFDGAGGVSSMPTPMSGHGAMNMPPAMEDVNGMPAPGSWDGMHDMQVDMSGWTFPDFWAFDMGGEF
ncbi:hypothetical protein BDV95DRAFT_625539 [Massariosphaeria phaeospora]|uniref:Zn(2)-C6 fungal-type domain-containing protein n=1 Tax=Massariosphaeria phaeospora TaxID=100035 RepID=A0A7C8ICH5_9PLEO|nr:hypothetical protein BDV95DRAFT_625539 [Massariosphaeria phaeospora]